MKDDEALRILRRYQREVRKDMMRGMSSEELETKYAVLLAACDEIERISKDEPTIRRIK